MNRMTGDGGLTGTSQSNKKESHAMDIQRHPFRVTAPWGQGLFGQLAAALDDLRALPSDLKSQAGCMPSIEEDDI
ncbi:MAG: hypothetical protein JJU05_10140 [Verrucomicrobia bacterium]|nr:hypothetical protein [Verrucomicrobiota bacterium]MCH8526648.1 hypothetical protein [Kiritimatiellia bacterium]